MSTAAKVAADKRKHPERFCPEPRCLWKTGDGSRCPRHKPDDGHHLDDGRRYVVNHKDGQTQDWRGVQAEWRKS